MRRRIFLHGVARGASAAALFLATGCGSAELDCAAPPGLTDAERTQRTNLHYRERAGDRVRNCAGCNFFTAPPSENACGACSLGLGTVNPAGVCDGFAARA